MEDQRIGEGKDRRREDMGRGKGKEAGSRDNNEDGKGTMEEEHVSGDERI